MDKPEVWTAEQWREYARTGKKPAAAGEALPSPPVHTPPTKAETAAEKATHTLICQELNRREIEYLHAAMNKKSTLPVGWPDFTIFQLSGVWLAEIKTPEGTLSTDQKKRISKLITQGYHVYVCRSFEHFKAIMLERENLTNHTYVRPTEIPE